MTNIILCGGSGTRLWPVSTPDFPKQFCAFFGETTLFQATLARNRGLADKTLIVTNVRHAPIAAKQLAGSGGAATVSFVLEPVGRNTAPALALACLELPAEELVLVTPSDHVIRDEKAYGEAVRAALDAAGQGSLVTFGLRPEYPETGYGYIEAAAADGLPGLPVASFREKPDRETAERYCADPRFSWNSGMFAFRSGVFLEELGRCAPDILEAARRARETASREADESLGYATMAPSLADMAAIRAESVDYAVMEKSKRVRVVPCSIGWSDLGSFDALYDISEKDGEGNAAPLGAVLLDSRRNLVVGGKRPVALVGMEDCVVVDSPAGLLVAKRGRSQDVKTVVEMIKNAHKS
jgi:mannose-1-phosphate guanylyltransferase